MLSPDPGANPVEESMRGENLRYVGFWLEADIGEAQLRRPLSARKQTCMS